MGVIGECDFLKSNAKWESVTSLTKKKKQAYFEVWKSLGKC